MRPLCCVMSMMVSKTRKRLADLYRNTFAHCPSSAANPPPPIIIGAGMSIHFSENCLVFFPLTFGSLSVYLCISISRPSDAIKHVMYKFYTEEHLDGNIDGIVDTELARDCLKYVRCNHRSALICSSFSIQWHDSHSNTSSINHLFDDASIVSPSPLQSFERYIGSFVLHQITQIILNLS